MEFLLVSDMNTDCPAMSVKVHMCMHAQCSVGFLIAVCVCVYMCDPDIYCTASVHSGDIRPAMQPTKHAPFPAALPNHPECRGLQHKGTCSHTQTMCSILKFEANFALHFTRNTLSLLDWRVMPAVCLVRQQVNKSGMKTWIFPWQP